MSLSLTPKQIVAELDQHIVGQQDAKRAVANALRNRWRRLQLEPQLRQEVSPKNILLIGATGVGKTEIARRLAKFAHAPFLKVEATKFTEVGYVGRDVESIIRDLADAAMHMLGKSEFEQVKDDVEAAVEQRLMRAISQVGLDEGEDGLKIGETAVREKLQRGDYDQEEVEINMRPGTPSVEFMVPPGMEEVGQHLKSMFSGMSGQQKKDQKLKIAVARKRLEEEETVDRIDEESLRTRVVDVVSEQGIVFIDELDKVTRREGFQGASDVSREGVQRDLLPLIEGCSVSTKYGIVNTDHILFIASGAFHLARPSDLIPELQGRLPVRVAMNALTTDDFRRILTEPKASLIKQYEALLATEGVTLSFTEDGIAEIAEMAWRTNESVENIGARRLHTLMEKLLEDLSFEAPELARPDTQKAVEVDAAYVKERLAELASQEDLSRYIL